MSDRLPRVSPEQRMVSPAAIQSFVYEIEHRGLELHSFMLLRHGIVEAEGWWAPYAPEHRHMLYSVSKSFTSTAIGLAEAEGRLSAQDKVTSYFPEWTPSAPSPHLAAMRIHDLLTMSTGHHTDTIDRIKETDPDNWVRGFLNLPVEHQPGTYFMYNSGASYMLSAIVQKVTGTTLLEYLQPRLLEPLGIEGAIWDTCPMGIHLGGWGLNLKTEDVAKFGQLYLQKGLWNEERLLPEDWVDRATSSQISNAPGWSKDWGCGYGYQFWRDRHNGYRGDGMHGQYCLVMPDHDAVLAITSGTEDMPGVLDAVWATLLPDLRAGSQSFDREATAALDDRLRSLALPLPSHHSSSPLETSISGKRYVLEDNEVEIGAVSFELNGEEAVFTVSESHGEYRNACGRGNWSVTDSERFDNRLANNGLRVDRRQQKVASSYTWRDDRTLLVTQVFIETPFSLTFECRFDGNELRLTMKQNTGRQESVTLVGKAAN